MDRLVGKCDLNHGSLLDQLAASSVEHLHHNGLGSGDSGEYNHGGNYYSSSAMRSRDHNFRTVRRSIRFS
jgi:hypothetical protein